MLYFECTRLKYILLKQYIYWKSEFLLHLGSGLISLSTVKNNERYNFYKIINKKYEYSKLIKMY